MDVNAFTNICRICLIEQGEFQSIFVCDDNTGFDIHIAEMIMAYASVQITFGDGLPEQICTDCAAKAAEMYIFKKLCEESDVSLREKFGKPPLLKVPSDTKNVSLTPEFDDDVKDVEVLIKSEMCSANDNVEGNGNINDIDIPECIVYECEQCLQQFTQIREFNSHKKTHPVPKQFQCDICAKTFSKKAFLHKHKLLHDVKSEDRSVSDNNVSASDSLTEASSDEHLLLPTPTFEGFKITEASKTSKKKSDLECFICTRKFTKPSHLTRHLKIHNPIKPHACKVCFKRYARLEQLTAHMNVHMGVKPHVCEICFKGFNQISNLKDHMRTHNGEKPFLCSTCGKGFNQLGNLRQHTIRHSGVKAHVCTFCGHGFASKGELCAHLRRHTGARPFVCQVCDHGFTTSSSLTKHKRIHSGEKPYECDVCHMRFSRSGILVRHKRTHTGEKPYVCKYCTKAFSQSNDLSSHLRIHTGEKPYICDKCGSAFRQSSALKTHKKTHADRSTNLESKAMLGMAPHTTFITNLQ